MLRAEDLPKLTDIMQPEILNGATGPTLVCGQRTMGGS